MSFLRSSVLVLVTAVLVSYLPTLIKRRLPPKGQGWAAPGWRKVADVFRQNLESGLERGGALAIYHQGELVVEFTGGYADEEAHLAWEKDTLVHICSTGKAVAAVVMAIMVDRGLIKYEDPVWKHWEEFAQNGKEDITIEELLSHQAGLAVIDEDFSAFDILQNPEKVGQILAKQAPNWTPGERHGYHGITLGLYIDQIVRRVDPLHRDLSQYLSDEISQQFGLDVHFGLPLEENYRCARTEGFSPYDIPQVLAAVRYWEVVWAYITEPDSITTRSIVHPTEYTKEGIFNNPNFRAIPNASNHGFATAVSLAKLFGILANGGMEDGISLLSEKRIAALQEELVSGKDEVLRMNLTYGRGVTLRRTPTGGFMFGAPGSGGQMAYADPERHLGWSYLTNYHSIYAIGDDPRYLAIEKAMYECVQDIENKNK